MAVRTPLTLVTFLGLTACAGPEPADVHPTTPAGMPAIEAADVERLDGVVHEVLPAGHYTYIRVGPPESDGDWAVVMGRLDAETGDTLSLRVQGSKTDFHSRRLDRDFERLFFASVSTRA